MKMKTNSALSLVVGAASLAGIILAPVVSAASTTTINAVVAKSAAVATTSGTVTINITPTAAGSFSSNSDTVTAGTNSATGYQLQISAATPALTGGTTIPAMPGSTPASPIALTVNHWGYRVDGASGFLSGPTSAQTNAASLTGTWAGVTSTPTTFKTTSSSANSDSTTVWYGVGADFTNANATYTTSVTYTAVAN